MKIAIDLSQIDRDGAGVNNYTRGILEGFAKIKQHQFVLCFRDTESADIELPDNFSTLVIPPVPKYLGGGFGWYGSLGARLKKERVDYLVSATLSSAALFFPTIVILHDLAPITHPETFQKSLLWRFKLNLWIATRFAARIAAVTNTTRDAFLKIFPKYKQQISITNEGLSKWTNKPFSQQKINQVRELLQLPEKYIFSLGTVQPRKNYLRAIRAFAEISVENPNLNYVIGGGKGWLFESIYTEILKLGIKDKVHFTGFIDEEDLPYVFDDAIGLVQVSLEEGFGLPIIEARSRRLPLLLSDIPVFRELELDIDPIWVDPMSEQSIVTGLNELLQQRHVPMATQLRDLYSWDQVAQNVIDSIAE